MSSLELKESNSPFWLVGFKNKKYITGNDGNVAIHFKTKNKQIQQAKEVINNKSGKIDEYYLVSGLVWDNMPNDSNQAIYTYIKSKGKLVASKEDINSEEKNECQINHTIDYPKGISRNSLVNKRKVYTNMGMALENNDEGVDKTMLELNITTENKFNPGDRVRNIGNPPGYGIPGKKTPGYGNEGTINKATHDGQFFIDWDNGKSTYLGPANLELIEDIQTTLELKINEEQLNEDLINGVTALKIGDKIQSDKNKDVIYEIISIFINEEGQPILFCKNVRTGKEIEIDPKGIFAKGAHKLKESKSLTEDNFTSIDDLIKELKTDTNYDEIAYHINAYSKVNKDHANSLMNKLKELEDEKSPKECVKELLKGLKEAAVIKPVGASQQVDAFVNIDIDLDNVTVSDYIVRLAQVIRSEQKSILEVDALLASDGIVGADRKDIEEIREDEKDHMVIYSRLLRKSIEQNFKSNENRVDNELGEDKQEDNEIKKESLKEAIEIANKYLNEDSGDEIRAQAQSEESKTEEDYKTWLADGRRELLKNWSKEDLQAMYNWCETELDNSLAKDVVGWVLKDEIDSRDSYYQKEAINIVSDETMSQDQYEVTVDVKYDEDFIIQVASNIKNAIEQFNQDWNIKGIGIDVNTLKFGNGKMQFVLIQKNGSEIQLGDNKIWEFAKILCDKATTYEYFVELKEETEIMAETSDKKVIYN